MTASYFSPTPDNVLSYHPTLYIDHISSTGTFIEGWAVDNSSGKVLAITVAPDGNAYYLLQHDVCLRLYKLGQNGQSSQVAGGDCSNLVASGDGGPARAATFKALSSMDGSPAADLAAGPDGSLYIANQSECRVRRIDPTGTIKTVAGTTCPAPGDHTGDGGPATAAKILPMAITVGRDNTLFVGDYEYWRVNCATGWKGCFVWGTATWQDPRSRIRTVRDGVINSIAGGSATWSPPHTLALQRVMRIVVDFALGADGRLYYAEGQFQNPGGSQMADDFPFAIHWVGNSMPSVPAQIVAIRLPSLNGSEIYNFDSTGLHLSTTDALTGATVYQFGYNPDGLLVSITDRTNLVTQVVRDASTGVATAIIAPNGQRTELTMTDGYLSDIDEPGGAHRSFTYYDGGLLKTYAKPNNASWSFKYDELGRLVHEDMPEGGSWALSRTGPTTQDPTAPIHVTAVSAEGKVWTCEGATGKDGNQTRTTSGPTGLPTTRFNGQTGRNTLATPDGMMSTSDLAPDPVNGMQQPYASSATQATPGGKTRTTTMSRVANMSGTSVTSRVDTVSVNGKSSTSTYNVAAKTITSVSPAGRQTVTTLDSQDRVTKLEPANLAPTAYGYDPRGRLSSVTVGNGTSVMMTWIGCGP